MTDDLVKRLRFGVAIDEQGDVSWCSQEVMFNAADRIEKLEAALRRIKHMHEGRGVDDIVERDDRTYFIVCNALEGKDD